MELLQNLLQQIQALQPSPFVLNVLTLGVWLILLAVVFVPLERLCSLHPRHVLRSVLATDLGYYFLNSLLPKLLLVIPLSAVSWGVHHWVPSGLYLAAAGIPLWMRFPTALLVGEIGTYWGHRWMHQFPLLWRFHAIHHGAQHINWLVNTRAHPLDLVFTRMCGLVPLYVLGLAQPSGSGMDMLPLLYALGGTVWGFFIHANLRWRFGCLEQLISTPAFHHWHHANDGPACMGKNYAATFPWVDRVFGTLYLPGSSWPQKCGIDTPIPASLGAQLVQPFLRKRGEKFHG